MLLPERLRELRKERQLRLKDVANAPGVELSISQLSDFERGRVTPSLEQVRTLANFYHLTPHDLLAGVDWFGDMTTHGLPLGLQDLLEDRELGPALTEDWINTLSRIDLRGHRPQSKADWTLLFLVLRRVIPVHPEIHTHKVASCPILAARSAEGMA